MISLTQLKAYADEGGPLDSWGEAEFRGFTVSEDASDQAYAFFYGPTIVLLFVLVAIFLKIAISKWLENNLVWIANEKKPTYQLFISIYIITAFLNWIFIACELAGVIFWVTIGRAEGQACKAVTTKFMCVIITLLVALLFAWKISKTFNRKSKKEVPDSIIKLYARIFSLGCIPWIVFNCRAKKRPTESVSMHKYTSDDSGDHAISIDNDCATDANSTDTNECLETMSYRVLAVWNFLVFAVIIVWNVIPTILLIFINPVETLAVLALAVSVFFLFSVSLAILLFKVNSKNPTTTKKIVLTLLIIIFLVYVFIHTLYLYVRLIDRGINTGGFLGYIVTVVPAVITTAAAWGGKKILQGLDLTEEESSTTKEAENQESKKAENQVGITVEEDETK